jgi:hypothetical protein
MECRQCFCDQIATLIFFYRSDVRRVGMESWSAALSLENPQSWSAQKKWINL